MTTETLDALAARLRSRGGRPFMVADGMGVDSTAHLILLKDLGITTVLAMLIGASLLGAAVTWCFAIETKEINLETV